MDSIRERGPASGSDRKLVLAIDDSVECERSITWALENIIRYAPHFWDVNCTLEIALLVLCMSRSVTVDFKFGHVLQARGRGEPASVVTKYSLSCRNPNGCFFFSCQQAGASISAHIWPSESHAGRPRLFVLGTTVPGTPWRRISEPTI
jgi:hypothetical protein